MNFGQTIIILSPNQMGCTNHFQNGVLLIVGINATIRRNANAGAQLIGHFVLVLG